jgi:hypothetical protein
MSTGLFCNGSDGNGVYLPTFGPCFSQVGRRGRRKKGLLESTDIHSFRYGMICPSRSHLEKQVQMQ